MPDDASNWIDDELRRVPLPPGLLERLRAAGRLADEDVDLALRDVAVPVNLVERLSTIVEDGHLDRQLCEVAVPEDLLGSLAFIPHEDALCEVPVPADLLVGLRRIPPRRRRRIPAMHIALAASLVLMITAGYGLSVAGLVLTAYDRLPEPYAELSLEQPPVELTSDATAAEAVVIGAPRDEIASPTPVESAPPFDPAPPQLDTRTIAEMWADTLGDGFELSDSVAPYRYGILGHAYVADDRTPDLELLTPTAGRGIEAPIALGFDRQFLVTKRTNPVVSLADIKRLAEGSRQQALLDAVRHGHLPLWTRTESFDQLRGVNGRSSLPSPREIHVEDFLAAVDFQYTPARPGQLAIRATAGPSVFGEAYAQLMQVGVQAGDVKDNARAAKHVTLAIDLSDSMRWGNRWNIVRAAVADFTRLLRGEDRVTLIVFNHRAYMLLEDVAGDDAVSLNLALDQLSPHGGTSAVAGLQLAADATQSDDALRLDRHLVVISDGMPNLPAETAAGVSRLIDGLARGRVAIDIVAVGEDDDLSNNNAGMQQLAAMAGGEVIRCTNNTTLREYLCDRLLGQSPVVARDGTVTISFNPKSVARYRLLGHESTSAGGTLTAETKSTLLAGEAATVLHEVWLEDQGPSLVAVVLVEWTDADGRVQTVRQEIHRRQFTTSWRGSPLPLQAAAIAAEAAEVLRQSPFAPAGNRDLRAVLAQAEEVNPLLGQRESFQQFVRVLEQTEATRRGVDAP